MKKYAERYLPFVLLLIGGLRLLWERFPHRFGFLRILGGEHYGWIFWVAGLTGLLMLIGRGLPEMPEAGLAETDGETRLQRLIRKYGIEALILLVTAASLGMLIRSGYFWDDAVNSTGYLAEKRDGVSTLRHLLDFMRNYLRLGRINLFSAYYYFFFYIENVHVYKALIILMILGNQLIFRNVLMEFGFSLREARLGMLLIPLLLQTRVYQDPVSGFYGLMQVLTAEMLLCAYFLSRWLRSGKRSQLILSLLCFGLGLMTYEVCFPFLLMICLLILVRRKHFGRAVRDSLPFVGMVIVMLAAVFYVRSRFVTKSTYAGVAFSPDPVLILRTYLRQVTAGLPLNFYSAGYMASVMDKTYAASSFMNYDLRKVLGSVDIADLLILAVGLICALGLIRYGRKDSRTSGDQVVLGFSFALLPAVTVAVSQRYQGQLMPGLGYLPVYMQYFGIAVLGLLMLRGLQRSAFGRALFLSAFSVILLLNLQNNRAVTDILNRSFYYPRNAGEAALHGGILDFLPEDAVLISANDRRYLWEADWNNHGLYPEFYSNYSRHYPGIIGDHNVLRERLADSAAEGAPVDAEGFVSFKADDVWLIAYNGRDDLGFARLGRLRSAKINPKSGEIREAQTDRSLCFITGAYPEKTEMLYTNAAGNLKRTVQTGRKRVRASEYGILYELPKDEVLLFDSISPDPAVF